MANRAARTEDPVVVIAGERVSLRELEAVLQQHADVAEVVVVAAADGLTLWAFVTPVADVIAVDMLAADLKGWARREIGPHAVPKEVQFGDLPRTAGGQAARSVLQKRADEAAG